MYNSPTHTSLLFLRVTISIFAMKVYTSFGRYPYFLFVVQKQNLYGFSIHNGNQIYLVLSFSSARDHHNQIFKKFSALLKAFWLSRGILCLGNREVGR